MILTGKQIHSEVNNGNIIIEPFSDKHIEPNSYGFHIGNRILQYDSKTIDASKKNITKDINTFKRIVLLPNQLYLFDTYEKMGSAIYAQTLYARLSTALCGMWIQFSAPLGHIGAVVNWTLEVQVAQPLIIYPYIKIGKIAFWKSIGDVISYRGRYLNSSQVVASRFNYDCKRKYDHN
jgi:dCTP deaminase